MLRHVTTRQRFNWSDVGRGRPWLICKLWTAAGVLNLCKVPAGEGEGSAWEPSLQTFTVKMRRQSEQAEERSHIRLEMVHGNKVLTHISDITCLYDGILHPDSQPHVGQLSYWKDLDSSGRRSSGYQHSSEAIVIHTLQTKQHPGLWAAPPLSFTRSLLSYRLDFKDYFYFMCMLAHM